MMIITSYIEHLGVLFLLLFWLVLFLSQLMANWFGAQWFGFLESPYERDWDSWVYPDSNPKPRAPNQQLTVC